MIAGLANNGGGSAYQVNAVAEHSLAHLDVGPGIIGHVGDGNHKGNIAGVGKLGHQLPAVGLKQFHRFRGVHDHVIHVAVQYRGCHRGSVAGVQEGDRIGAPIMFLPVVLVAGKAKRVVLNVGIHDVGTRAVEGSHHRVKTDGVKGVFAENLHRQQPGLVVYVEFGVLHLNGVVAGLANLGGVANLCAATVVDPGLDGPGDVFCRQRCAVVEFDALLDLNGDQEVFFVHVKGFCQNKVVVIGSALNLFAQRLHAEAAPCNGVAGLIGGKEVVKDGIGGKYHVAALVLLILVDGCGLRCACSRRSVGRVACRGAAGGTTAAGCQ